MAAQEFHHRHIHRRCLCLFTCLLHPSSVVRGPVQLLKNLPIRPPLSPPPPAPFSMLCSSRAAMALMACVLCGSSWTRRQNFLAADQFSPALATCPRNSFTRGMAVVSDIFSISL